MPSLIRLIIFLLFLAGIGYGAMFALVAFVEPGQKEVTVRIPARDLLGESNRNQAGADDTGATTPTTEAETPAAEATADTPADQPE